MLFDNSYGGHAVVTCTNHNPLCMTFRSTKFGSPSVPTCLTKGSGGTRSCEVESKGESDRREREGSVPALWIQIEMLTKSAQGRCDLCDRDPFVSHIWTRKNINIKNFCCRKCGSAVEERWAKNDKKLSGPSYTTCEREAKTRFFPRFLVSACGKRKTGFLTVFRGV